MNEAQMNSKTKSKAPISSDKIYTIMVISIIGVIMGFLLKNIIFFQQTALIVICVCLIIFAVAVLAMKFFNTPKQIRYFLVSGSMAFIVFIISLFSGDYYSDDFILYLALIGLTGIYMRPTYTLLQGFLCVFLLCIQAAIHPSKAGDLSQYLICILVFMVACIMIYLAIQRGRAFIEISQKRAFEAERLLDSIREAGTDLQNNFKKSTNLLNNLQNANQQLEKNTDELRIGSQGITQGTKDVVNTCEDVHNRLVQTEQQITALNNVVQGLEFILSSNFEYIDTMTNRIHAVRNMMQQSYDVFHLLDRQMLEITEVTEQLNKISSNTTMLALNASIEAARAGKNGAGFAVVASKVQDLAVDSNRCSDQVAGVITAMQQQIQETTRQLDDSDQAIHNSFEALDQLTNGFTQLIQQFASLYENIAKQNNNVTQVDSYFNMLQEKITEMSFYSNANQNAVDSISDAMYLYQENIHIVLEDTKHLHDLSASMLSISKEE